MTKAELVTTMVSVAVALGIWWGIARDERERRRERKEVAEWFADARLVLSVEEFAYTAEMLTLSSATPVVQEIVDNAFESVNSKIRQGAVTATDDARRRLREAVRAGVLAKMTRDYQRAFDHGAVRHDLPALSPDGTVNPATRSHLESMPPDARFRFMQRRMHADSGRLQGGST